MDFQYPKMTPELQVYLTRNTQHPGYKYPEGPTGKPTPESAAAVDAWRDEVAALRARLPVGEPGAYYEAHKVWLCRDEAQQGDANEHPSPSGKYKLVVTRHGTGPNSWDYSKGRVYRQDGTLIETVCRNYGAFPFEWVEDHPKTGHDYILCGHHYMGQTVIDLVTGVRVDHLGEGEGFCWSSLHISPDKLTLAVNGCYWACPSEVWFHDFTNPMESPLLVLSRNRDAEHLIGWQEGEPSTCDMGEEFNVYIPLGKPELQMTDDDWADCERREQAGEPDLWKVGQTRTKSWQRPSDFGLSQSPGTFQAVCQDHTEGAIATEDHPSTPDPKHPKKEVHQVFRMEAGRDPNANPRVSRS